MPTAKKKKKNYTHVAVQVQAFRRKPKKLRLFSRNIKTEVKENHLTVDLMAHCICDQILSENICRNINHRN